jgi:hypothetical protein
LHGKQECALDYVDSEPVLLVAQGNSDRYPRIDAG